MASRLLKALTHWYVIQLFSIDLIDRKIGFSAGYQLAVA